MSLDAMKQASALICSARLCEVNSMSSRREMLRLMIEATDTLRAAIKQAQEPVAWAEEIIDDLNALHDTEMIRENDSGDALIRLDDAIACVEDAKQHYTAPTPRQWKGLTPSEITAIELSLRQYHDGDRYDLSLADFASAIEAKLKEKNT